MQCLHTYDERQFPADCHEQVPPILACGHVDTGAGCETVGCPNVRIHPSWNHVDTTVCMNRSPEVEDGVAFYCTQDPDHKGWHIAEGWTDPLRAWHSEREGIFRLERMES